MKNTYNTLNKFEEDILEFSNTGINREIKKSLKIIKLGGIVKKIKTFH